VQALQIMMRTVEAFVPERRAPSSYARSLAFVVLALGGACGSSDQSPEDDLRPEIPVDARACDIDDDCGLVYVDCLGCEREAINKSAADEHRTAREEKCNEYLGPFDGCDESVIVARCERKVCVVRKSSEADTVVTRSHEVEVMSAYTQCNADIDCTSVETGCDGCCQTAAISESAAEQYQTDKIDLCSGFQGGQCDCQPVSIVPICKDGVCVSK
jgi:hypothetical protein